jgi:hypothetical protein
MAWLGRKLFVEEKQTAVELPQERLEKNCENTVPSLNRTPCCESMNNLNIQEWMNQDQNS